MLNFGMWNLQIAIAKAPPAARARGSDGFAQWHRVQWLRLSASLAALAGRAALLVVAMALLAMPAALAEARAETPSPPQHGIAMHGIPALKPGFGSMPYANPAAPKGGRLTFGILGAFDSLNPLIVKGIAVSQIRGYVIESLMTRGQDEPFTLYGLIAERVEMDEARSVVIFHLNPNARFADGKPILADDVLFSWQLLRDKGRPNHRLYYAKVTKAEALNERAVRFDIAAAKDRELPLILGLMPVLPKHAIDPDRFEETSFTAPLGSGPYRVASVKPGAQVVLARNLDYWGRDLPVNRGLWNFDEVRLDFYREANGHFEAFKRGLYDFRIEHEPLRWKTGYDFEAAKSGEVVLDTIKPFVPRPSEYLVFNTRRAIFKDARVREALGLLFDFEWMNRNYFHGLFVRSMSYFPGSVLSAEGVAANAQERALLSKFPDAVRADILDGTYRLHVSDGSGHDRAALRRALDLLAAAGFALKGREMRNNATGEVLAFEILVTSRDQERVAITYAQALARAGIRASVRALDAVQFDQRRLSFDFDMIPNRWDQSLSPGNEQAFYFGSEAASQNGTRNYMGVQSAAADAMINAMLAATDRAAFEAAVRALDRVLMSGFYTVPVSGPPAQWLARWRRIARPAQTALYGYLPETWWSAAPGK